LNDGSVSTVSAFALMHEAAEQRLVVQMFTPMDDHLPPEDQGENLIGTVAHMRINQSSAWAAEMREALPSAAEKA
jgi:hypothetical protein